MRPPLLAEAPALMMTGQDADLNSYIFFSSWRAGFFPSCCLVLDSSPSFPCPAFPVIAKSIFLTLLSPISTF
ncbi:hypothetical protein STEG23_032416 [Scotinomys teguina]